LKIHSSMIRKFWSQIRTLLVIRQMSLIKKCLPVEQFKSDQVKNILIIRLDKVGDLILSTPVFQNLKNNLPGARITALVRKYNSGVLKNNPFVDEVLIYDKIEERRKAQNGGFDMAIDLIYDFNLESALACYNSGASFRVGYKDKYSAYFYNIEAEKDPSPKYELQRNLDILKYLRMSIDCEASRLFPSQEEIRECFNFIKSLNIEEKAITIGINPGTGRRRREWPLEKYVELGKRLVLNKNARILVTWGEKDKSLAQKLVQKIGPGACLAPGTNITSLAALLTFCDVFICGNTGPSHIAMAMKVPLVGLYGKNDDLNWTPEKKDNIAVVSADKCSLIQVSDVIKGVEKFL